MEKLLISACLLGVRCRYDGKSKPLPPETIEKLTARYDLVPVCPEQLGGLPTPRLPSERRGEEVIRKDGVSLTEEYRCGAEEALRIAQLTGCRKALMKARSPACGRGLVYDGTFSRTLIPGNGVTAQLLLQNEIEVFTEEALQL